MNYPEHEKLNDVSHESQVCFGFLEWLTNEAGLVVCEMDTGNAPFHDEFFPKTESNEQLMARYFKINLVKIAQEQARMLDEFNTQIPDSVRTPQQGEDE